MRAHTELTSPKDWALAYAKLGWHIFPCRDKQPLTPNGFKDASRDAEQVARYWTDHPDAEIGWVPGLSGHVVIDLDVPKNGGGDGQQTFQKIRGDEPIGTCLLASTPSGGSHLVYRAPEGRRYGMANLKHLGIDVRGHGGYVIVPDARPGREWCEDSPFECDAQEAPPWLTNWLDGTVGPAKGPTLGRVPRTYGRMMPAGTASDDRLAEVRGALFAVPATVGRDVWLRCIFAVHDALRGDERGADLVEEWSSQAPAYTELDGGQYREDEAFRIYANAVGYAPRVFAGIAGVGARTLFKLARDHGWKPEARSLEVVFDSGSDTGETRDASETSSPNAAECLPPTPDAIRLRDWNAVAELPMVRWLVKRVLPERGMIVLAGDTMMGKSFLAIDLSMRLVHDKPFFGHKVRPCSVLYLCGEGQEGLAARLRVWRDHNGVTETDAGGRFCLISNRIPELNATSVKALRKLIKDIVARKGHAPGLVVVDTLSQALDGDENDAVVTAPVLRALARLRDEFGCTILLLHHIVKRDQKTAYDRSGNARWFAVTLNAVRGSGAITRNMDTVLGVQPSKSNRTVFELVTLKQKDGALGSAIRFQRQVVQTGRVDEDGEQESSCVLVPVTGPDCSAQVDPDQSEDDRLRAEEDRRIERLVGAVRREGRFTARDSLVKAAGGNMQDGRAALDLALSRGRIVDLGSSKRPVLVLPEDAPRVRLELEQARQARRGQPREGGGSPPYTPSTGGRIEPSASNPSSPPRTDGTVQTPGGILE